MLLFAGLGNPGRQHAGQRHNIGFMAVDAIARAHNAPPFRARFQGQVSELPLGGDRAVLLKPNTFMNESGRAVGDAMRFYKLALKDVVVFHDELDIPAGTLRVKTGGGNAGHNGLRSITALCGNDYRRVRLGIGHPGAKELVLGYVLGSFDKDEHGWVEVMCDAVAANAADLVSSDDAGFAARAQLRLAAAGFA